MGFFKAYDMRGAFGKDFTLDTVRMVGRSLPGIVSPGPGARRWLVGRDGRLTGGAIRDALAAGLAESGADVTDLGLCTTPMVYFFTGRDGYDGSVMITASHNPPSDNGLKVSRATALPVGYADGLDRVERLVASGEAEAAAPARRAVAPRPASADALREYVAWMRSRPGAEAARGARIAVDCSNGMAALFARELFPRALIINEDIDGSFPSHSPNPLDPASRVQISRAVVENGLDLGIIFDGDADRAMFVDENGSFVQPDWLIPAVAKATAGGGGAGRKVLHDVRTSRGAIEALREADFTPVMVPVGHAFAKPAMRSERAVCGGELAGHYYFEEFYGCDSGALAALRVLSAAAAASAGGKRFSEMVGEVSRRYANSGEMNFLVEDKEAAIARVMECAAARLPREISRSAIDGVRIEYAQGWVNVRRSNTEPYLRLVLECDTAGRLEEWKGLLSAAINASPGSPHA